VDISNFRQVSEFFFKTRFMAFICFTEKDNGPPIEKYIKQKKSIWEKDWKNSVWLGFKDEATKWWFSLDNK